MRKYLCTAFAGLLLALSCRSLVLEDRNGCPAYVYFDPLEEISAGQKEFVQITVMDAHSLETLAQDKAIISEISPDSYALAIDKRPEVLATGTLGIRMSEAVDGKLVVPYGNQGDPLYHFSSRESLREEEIHIPVHLKKEHSKVRLSFTADDSGSYPYSIVVKGNTCGMDPVSGKPVQGPFKYVPLETEAGIFYFTLPRQWDYSLTIELWAKPGYTDSYGKASEILLWQVLQNIEGFDWGIENLPDLELTIDYSNAAIYVFVKDWNIESTSTLII